MPATLKPDIIFFGFSALKNACLVISGRSKIVKVFPGLRKEEETKP